MRNTRGTVAGCSAGFLLLQMVMHSLASWQRDPVAPHQRLQTSPGSCDAIARTSATAKCVLSASACLAYAPPATAARLADSDIHAEGFSARATLLAPDP